MDFTTISSEELTNLAFQINKELGIRERNEYLANVKKVIDIISPMVKNYPDRIAIEGTEGDIDWKTLYEKLFTIGFIKN